MKSANVGRLAWSSRDLNMHCLDKLLRTLSIMLVIASVPGLTLALPPQTKPTPAVCKADLKEWSVQRTETLTLDQINERMNMMVACADEAHHHRHSDKTSLAYLNEFYRVHAELANRTFDFITRHNLKAQFDEEENGTASAQTSSHGTGSDQ